MLIAGVLATAVVATASFRSASAKEEAARLASLIDHAEVMASTLGSPLGLEVAADHYQFLRWSGTWDLIESGELSGRYSLPTGIAVEALADAASGSAAPRILRFPPAGYPPPFDLRVSGAGDEWHVKGNLVGRVVVETRAVVQ